MTEMKLLHYQPLDGGAPRASSGRTPPAVALPEPNLRSGIALLAALSFRRSVRQFSDEPLTDQQLGELLWAADGVNRSVTGGRTTPSAHGLHEVDIYVALPYGVYRYEPRHHRLVLKRNIDARNLTGYQDFVGHAPLDLVYVVNYGRLAQTPPQQRDIFSAATAGAISQNVSLYCASTGLGTVVRGWLNRRNLAEALGLNEDEVPVLAQTVGVPAAHGV